LDAKIAPQGVVIASEFTAGALPTIDEFVNRIRSDGTVQKGIAEAGLRGVRVP
jgi:hypothetical protein